MYVIGTWKATTPGPGEPPPSHPAKPVMPGARPIRGTSSWKRSTATCWNETTIRSRRLTSFNRRASTSALRMYSDGSSAGVRPLISTLIGVCGKARSTWLSVGTRKSDALKPLGGRRFPVAMPRSR